MSKKRPVPRLYLAPKLKRPLYLWNPLDYLRLLYWVFFFPQALPWYLDTFGGGDIPDSEMSKIWELLRQNYILLQLLLQGLLLTVITPLCLGIFLQEIGITINWLGVGLGVGLGVAGSVAGGVAGSVVGGVAGGVVGGVAFGVGSGVTGGLAFGLAFALAFGLAFGMVGFGVTRGVWFSLAFGVAFGLAFDQAFGLAFGVTFSLAIIRLENWLIGSLFNLHSVQNGSWLLPRITPLPLPYLTSRLTNWLRQDWEIGMNNANQLLLYTNQDILAIKVVYQELAKLPSDQVIFRVTQLADKPYYWQLVDKILNKYAHNTPVNDALASLAGFWYLHKKQPTQAVKAFAMVRSIPYGEELFIFAKTIEVCYGSRYVARISSIKLPALPNEQLLRPLSWKAINSLHLVLKESKVVQHSISDSTRSFALNRALGELTHLLDQSGTLPKAEAGLIVDIARTWQETLLNMAGEVGEVSIPQPVTNPYIIGDPVEGNLFVGRGDILRQLEELWVMSPQLQSVVLYGHRRMGKTSILRNVANSGAEVRVIYVNLQRLGDISQVGEVLIAISDEIATALQLPPPEDQAMLELPEQNFERYLKKVLAEIDRQGVIIALDEFETIEELIEAGKIPSGFMGYLRGLVQMSSKIAFAFAGLHTLEEMTADYFQPFYASVIPIRVGFLTAGSTAKLLAKPAEDFPLDYHPEALDQIYALTGGQPYLVQLIGFQLVRRYNDQVFELGRTRDQVFTVEDVEVVINDEFFARGRYYFTGVWGQAAQGPSGQQDIIRAIVPHREGLNLEEIARHTNLEHSSLQPAIETLRRHDVVAEKEGRWYIIVELFRRWVLNIE